MLAVPGVRQERFPLSTGVTVNVAFADWEPGIPTVLLPGLADSWWSWSRVLPALAGAGPVMAVDPRGHGSSDRPPCCYAVEDVAGDVVALLDTLELARAVLIGHSGGCFTARHIALSHPDRVAGLGLIASPIALDRSELGEVIEAVRALDDPVPEAFVRAFQEGTAHVPLPEQFLDGIVAESRRLPAHVWRSTLDGLLAYRDEADLARVRAPTTLVWGDRDTIVSRDDQERLARAIPDASFIVVPETGHCPHWERPDEVGVALRSIAARAN